MVNQRFVALFAQPEIHHVFDTITGQGGTSNGINLILCFVVTDFYQINMWVAVIIVRDNIRPFFLPFRLGDARA